MEIVQAVKKLNSISRERLNFRRRPILCTTLYRNPMQASNFGGTFDQLFLRIFYKIFTEDASLSRLYHGAKKSKMTKNSNQGGGPALRKIESAGKENAGKGLASMVFANLLDSFPRESNGKGNGLHAFTSQDQKSRFLVLPEPSLQLTPAILQSASHRVNVQIELISGSGLSRVTLGN